MKTPAPTLTRRAALLAALQRGVTRGEDLAAAAGVNVRTAYRYIEALRRAGIPIRGEAGAGFYLRKTKDGGDWARPARGETVYFDKFLSCDYGPDADLAAAASAAGIPHSAFSWKSHVHLMSDCVSYRLGYGGREQYHYPLSDGSWLICGLRGDDMPAIVAAVEAGSLPSLQVERLGETAHG